ncbi:MAG: hypothetical protein AD742_01825 [Methylibium sp. NZG]|nr:MAG: hypothetical protein AD742_01825 [Methylibium sp. NZG]
MTEASSKGLTWATLVAGVVSAFALAAIGCIKPMPVHDDAGGSRDSSQRAADAADAIAPAARH